MKILICGAGIAGLALANRLAVRGFQVVLLERSRVPREQGYMIDFFGPGYDAIEAMGLLPAVSAISYDLDEAVLLDDRGRRRAGVDPARFAAEAPRLDLMRPDLERVLRENLPPSVELRYGARVTGVVDRVDQVTVMLADRSTLTGDLLVGADGIHSTVREQVFGPEVDYLRYLGYQTAAFVFDDPAIYAEIGGRFCLTDTVGRQLGLYGLRDGRVATYAVHRTADPTLPQDPRAAVRDIYAELGWVAPAVLQSCPPPREMYYDLVAQAIVPQWSRGRVVLVGDAGYAVSLLAGLGASLGVAGGYLLAEQLFRARSVADGLAGYEALWRPLVEDKQRSARDAVRWFLPENTIQLLVRRAALRLSRLPIVERRLAGIIGGTSSAVITNLRDADAFDVRRPG
ncbi:FAD-dependent monooxygenase [Microlunatus soli]|uniref:2-polyprenyl-6-methoxyphenol hydroxylase n=1 Tax=Microlunatus soli TaxID=630515 RepID=A0A1H1XJ32_9ACTN|nr:FAD-dependent monooxygenase [Microlunatus soli]SDT09274.1 2-polyprenyl-6-methoxyphenol hydroxylase [Microlunatus soli]